MDTEHQSVTFTSVSVEQLEREIERYGDRMTSLKLTWTGTVGLLLRGRVRRELQQFCWANDLGLKWQEAKGWFESALHIKVKVAPGRAVEVKRFLDNWFEELGR